DRNRIVGVDDDLDVVAIARERLVDRVVEHLEHHVVQPGAVGRVTDVHPRPFTNGVEALQDLDARGVVGVAGLAWLGLGGGHQMRMGMTTYLKSSRSGSVTSALELASPKAKYTFSLAIVESTSSR